MNYAGNELMFSAASFWEIAIKRGRRGLLDNDYSELLIGCDQALAIDGLPRLHKDPFDRILIAQVMVEGITLLTADPLVAQYSGPIRRV
jgi:PIN domain nuclease of toxin-antitoxin system